MSSIHQPILHQRLKTSDSSRAKMSAEPQGRTVTVTYV